MLSFGSFACALHSHICCRQIRPITCLVSDDGSMYNNFLPDNLNIRHRLNLFSFLVLKTVIVTFSAFYFSIEADYMHHWLLYSSREKIIFISKSQRKIKQPVFVQIMNIRLDLDSLIRYVSVRYMIFKMRGLVTPSIYTTTLLSFSGSICSLHCCYHRAGSQ